MNLSYFIAKRYFLSKKKKTFINVLSIISMVVVGTCTFSLILILSVYNGLEGLLRNLYGSFDAQVLILPERGKSFEYTGEIKNKLLKIDGVVSVADIIEDNALITYRDAQRIVRLKGVGEDFLKQNRFKNAQTYGPMHLKEDNVRYAIIGRGISNHLSIQLNDDFYPIQIDYPKDIEPGQLNPDRMFIKKHILPGSIFAVEKNIDDNYIFVPIEFSRELLNYGIKRTSLELGVEEGVNFHQLRDIINTSIGPDFKVMLGDEIHSDLYKILKWEKVIVFLALAAIIGIASINIYFSLSMLVIDKSKDLAILKAIGSPASLLQKIFLAEGTIIAFTGAFTGLTLGLLIAGIQQKFGLVGMGVQGAISDAYPVQIDWRDVLTTTLFIILITLLSAIQPARKAARTQALNLLQ
ncbi:MAG: ABC transporter permease [Cytophagales bacterium]|nr:ABC transporter permease [Cytophagales bacterium]